MPFQILLNILIAVMWMFMSESYTFSTFFGGYLIGILLLLVLQRFIPDAFYMQRVVKVLKLMLLFTKELILSNLQIVKLVYKPKLDITPGIFALPTELKSDWEITLLANLISLTPGTLSIAVSDDNSLIYIHAMHIDDTQESIQEIKDSFEKAIMEVTR
ncbi:MULTISPECIES: Na+/H+ antiporter subunit E [Sediminibacillus]|uniref:Multicomponent Na+:H+ antiporter subunit E n=2 Tax=Sediminibacillus TaxID=482460 RepID=A0A1G9XUX2_9BACI|nr:MULTISPECIES: Na+/H+ antiporter subunit E [Sediminibacillus]QTM99901.1 Na+/H+ antiporter subunit E [Sediminibacillus dalangtanensis]SDN00564.1 multicomponent Na+:H+ antiporter subunit E [Sediminibacillus halophilus]